MNFQIIPVAEANINTLMNNVDRVIVNPLIVLLFALAVVYFVYGLMQFLMSPDNEEIKKNSKQHMLWGIFGMFIMIAVFGILNIIMTTLGVNGIQIQNGSYNIGNLQ